MNDFSELEAQLRELRPAAPSANLATRVERALHEPSVATGGILPKRKMQMNWLSLGLGFAAAAALFLLVRPSSVTAPASRPATVAATARQPRLAPAGDAPRLLPDGVTRVVYGQRNEGLLYPMNRNQPVRRVRSRSQETLHWKNPETGASLRVSYPTEEVEFLPVAGQ